MQPDLICLKHQEQQDMFSSLVANVPGIIYRCRNDKDWTMLYISDGIEEVTGYPAADFIESIVRSYESIIHPEDTMMVADEIAAAISRGEPWLLEYRLCPKTGQTVWVEERGRGVVDDAGQVVFLDGYIGDITAHRQAEAYREFQLQFMQIATESFGTLSRIDDELGVGIAVEQALPQLGQLFGADRSYLFEYSADKSYLTNTHEWCAQGIVSEKNQLQKMPVDCFPWWNQQIQKGRPVQINDVALLPPEAACEQAEFCRQGITSTICLPTTGAGGHLTGFVGFDFIGRKKEWTDGQVTMLQLVANGIGATLERCRVQGELDRYRHHLEHLVAERTEDLTQVNLQLRQEIARGQQIAQKLQTSEEFRLRIFESSRIPIVIMDQKNGQIVECNPAAVTIYGFARKEEVLGKTPIDVSAPTQYAGEDSAARAQAHIAEAKARGSIVFEWRHQRPNGECWDAEVHLLSFLSGGKEYMQFALVDITQRKAAEVALAQINEQLEMKVEARTMELMAMNQELTALNDELTFANEKLTESNTELALTLEDLRQTQQRLLESEKMASLSRLVVGIAHEINTPLGVSMTAASFLTESNAKSKSMLETNQLHRHDLENYFAKVAEGTDLINSSLGKISQLVGRFKMISATQGGEIKHLFNLGELLKAAKCSFVLEKGNAPWQMVIDCDSRLEIVGYPVALAQVIQHLMVNAMVHAFTCDKPGEIRISAKLLQEQLEITFADNGQGIDAESLTKVFDPFFTTKRGKMGSQGLGLHIAYNAVVQLMGGSIECTSLPDRGTSFRLLIPVE